MNSAWYLANPFVKNVLCFSQLATLFENTNKENKNIIKNINDLILILNLVLQNKHN